MKLPLQGSRANDSTGMTLIEVIVAISIMGIVATAAIGLSITSQTSAAAQQRQELAVTVANQAMEFVSAQSATINPVTGQSYLLAGRTQANVTSNWTANAGASGLASTYPGWDSAATPVSTPPIAVTIPIMATVTESGTTYVTHTLIGPCYQSNSLPVSGDCGRLTGFLSAPVAAPAGYTAMLRVIVIVRWNAGSGCAASGCSYQTTSLVDAHSDLLWNTHA